MSIKCQKSFTLTVKTGIKLLAYYNMNAVGSWPDATPNGHDLSLSFGAVSSDTGILSNAVKFTVLGLLACPDSALIRFDPTKGMTLCGWLNMTAVSGAGAASPIAYFSSDSSFFFTLSRQATSLNFTGVDSMGNTDSIQIATNALNNTWFFYRVWFDPATLLIKAKVNEGATILGSVQLPTFNNVNGHFEFQKGNAASAYRHDEIAIYDSFLSDSDGAILYGAGTPPGYPNVPHA